MSAKAAAINFNWAKAEVGDLLPMPSPFKFGEIVAKLVKIGENGRFKVHTYDLFFYGVWIGTAEAKQDGAAIEWRMTV